MTHRWSPDTPKLRTNQNYDPECHNGKQQRKRQKFSCPRNLVKNWIKMWVGEDWENAFERSPCHFEASQPEETTGQISDSDLVQTDPPCGSQCGHAHRDHTA